ncbi:hypothetical protein KY312_00635 [Candidatus Woesearchaeota archaeon]|nr:hypothetical protein [Candidatus Woesearchaeota archaeon]
MRTVDIYYPVGGNNVICSSVQIHHSNDISIYQTVNEMKKILLDTSLKLKEVKPIPLNKVINLHNSNGIRDLKQVHNFVHDIESGIYYTDKFPNIKLAQISDDEYVIFDGHHSMLAFMLVGRKYLHEIPHLVVRNADSCISPSELCVCFGHHADKIKPENWRKYTIKWEEQEDKQLCKRIQNNMKELFEAVKPLLKDKR